MKSQLSKLSKEIVFWAWTNESMAVGPTVIWSLHVTWCCWCVHDMFWIWQVHHHISSRNGLLGCSLWAGFSLRIGSWFLCVLWLDGCCILEQLNKRMGWGRNFLFNELCCKCLGKYLWCVHSLDENVNSSERQVFVMLVLLADILTSNNQCMRTSLHIRTEGN